MYVYIQTLAGKKHLWVGKWGKGVEYKRGCEYTGALEFAD